METTASRPNTVPTAPVGTSTNQIASTAFVAQSIVGSGIAIPPGAPPFSLQYNSGGVFGGITLSDGQIPIGRSGNSPLATTLTAGTGISISTGPGSITINSTSGAAGNPGGSPNSVQFNSAGTF